MPSVAQYVGAVARFIALEGGEAVGKSTQAALLAEHLGAVLTREPGGTAAGEALRRLVLGAHADGEDLGEDVGGGPVPTFVAKAEALVMLAARAQHLAEVIEPALARGDDVVCDRYSGSTLAYQGYGRGLKVTELAQVDRWATGGRAPDRVVLLDLPVEVAAERRRGGSTDVIERAGEAFLQRVRAGYLLLAESDPERWAVVDGSGTVEQVSAAVREAVA